MPKDKAQATTGDDWIEEAGLLEENETAEPAETLTLASLLEETRIPFDLGGGQIIYFIDAKSIDAAGSARMMRLQKLLDGTLKRLESHPNDQTALERYEKITTEFILFILPDIPRDVLGKLKQGQRGLLLQHWTNNSDMNLLQKKAGRAI